MATLANRARMLTFTTGAGSVTLSGSCPGFATFAEAGVFDQDIVSYLIEEGNNFEVGRGMYIADGPEGPMLTRTNVILSKFSSLVGADRISLSGRAIVGISALKEDFDELATDVDLVNELERHEYDTGGALHLEGGSVAYSVTTQRVVTLAAGAAFSAVCNIANIGVSTLTVNGLETKPIRKILQAVGEVDLTPNDMVATGHYQFEYDGDRNSGGGAWVLINPSIGATGQIVPAPGTSGDLILTINALGVTTPVNCSGGHRMVTIPSYVNALAAGGNGAEITIAKSDSGNAISGAVPSAFFLTVVSEDPDDILGYPGPDFDIKYTGTLSSKFTTVAGDETITVAHEDHGLKPGDKVTYAGGVTFNGVTMAGTWPVATCPSFDSYTIEYPTPASASGTGGGSVAYTYPSIIGAHFQEDPFWTIHPFGRLRKAGGEGAAGGPFTTTLGSSIIEVLHPNHGNIVGDEATFYDCALFNGVDLDGTWAVIEVVSSSIFKVDCGQIATDSGIGGCQTWSVNGDHQVGWSYKNSLAAFVYVQHPAHGLVAGSGVIFSGAVAFAGINMNGPRTVSSVNGPNGYFIQYPTRATIRARGGGLNVTSDIPVRLRVMHASEDRIWRALTHARISGITGNFPDGINTDVEVKARPGGEQERTGKAMRAIDIDIGVPWMPGWQPTGGKMTYIQKKLMLRVHSGTITLKIDQSSGLWMVKYASDDVYLGPKDRMLWSENLGYAGPSVSFSGNTDVDFLHGALGRRTIDRSLGLQENGDPPDFVLKRIAKDYLGSGFWAYRFIGSGVGLGAIFWQGSSYPSGSTMGSAASIVAVAEEDFNTVGSGSQLRLSTTSKGQQEPDNRAVIESSGHIGLGGAGIGNQGNLSLRVMWHMTETGPSLYWGVVRGSRTAKAVWSVGSSNPSGTMTFSAKGLGGNHDFYTGGDGSGQDSPVALGVLALRVTHVADANRNLVIRGSNGGNPEIDASAGYIKFVKAPVLPLFTKGTAAALTPSAGAKLYITDLITGAPNIGGTVEGDGTVWRRSYDPNLVM